MKEEINRVIEENNGEENYKEPIMIGTGILIAYFVLFGYNSLLTGYKNEIFYLLRGRYNDPFASMMGLILSVISLCVLILGLYYFIKGLRKLKKSRAKTQNRGLQQFIIFYALFMSLVIINNISDSSTYFYDTYIGEIPSIMGWNIFFAQFFSGYVLFVLVIIMVAIQVPILRKWGLYSKDKRPKTHFFMVGPLVVCIILMWVNWLGFAFCHMITSILAAGVYLELILKLKKSKQEINIKS